MKKLKVAWNISELKSLLVLCKVFRRFVPNLSRITSPLNDKLRKDQPFNLALDEIELGAMKNLQENLISPPALTFQQAEEPMTLDTDDCDVQVGCVLFRKESNKMTMLIGYWSRSLINNERIYGTKQRECLAIASAVLLLWPYLEDSSPITISSIHDLLKKILKLWDTSGRLARWRL